MASNEGKREEDLRNLLTDAVEVQLATLRAGIGFWSEWIEKTTEFVQSASRILSEINSEEQSARDLVLELVDASRASARALTEIPRHTATRFIEELDRFDAEKASAPKSARASAPKKRKTAARSAPRARRAGRAKP
ncbi:MAG: hypothetical protein R3E10_10060 [Gemmatimonadota bacterium]